MDRFELVEKLVKSAGVSFEDAKIALENCNWDILDAAVWLEQHGKTDTKTGKFSTDPEQQQAQQQAAEQQRRQQYENPRGTSASQTSGRSVLHSILTRIKGILAYNELVICKQSGEIFLELPIWLFVVLLIVAFWPTIIVLLIVFILGFRFRLHGPDLGNDMVNNILNRAENSAAGFVDRVKRQYTSKGSASSNDRNEDVIDYEDPNKKE